MIATLLTDARYAMRGLWNSRGFTLVAILSLALGLGLNTAVFTVVDEMLFRPMAVRDPGALVAVFTSEEGGEANGTTSWADFVDLRDANTAFTDLVGHSLMMAAFGAPASPGGNRLVMGEVVTANYFSALGVSPALGRGFRLDEERPEGDHPVAVLGHPLWRSQFGGRTDVIGETFFLRNREYTIVGVAPEGFAGLTPGLAAALWIPVSMVEDVEPITINETAPSPGATRLERRGHRWLFALGRLRPGATAAVADANLDAIMTGLAATYPQSNEARSARVMPASGVRIHPLVDDALRPGGLVLLGAVSLVLLVACGNLASMLLARGLSRSREFALRAALGASRRRLVRQLIVENIVLALMGGGLGLAVGAWALRALGSIPMPFAIAIPLTFAIDLRVLAFAFALSVATGLVFGLLPAIRSSRTDLLSTLKADLTPRSHGRRFSLGHGLVVAQVAVSLVLVVGGALLARSVLAARDIDPGFDPAGLALVSVDLGLHGYSDEAAEQFYTRAIDRVTQLPGVSSAALSDRMPFSPNVHQRTIFVDGQPQATPPGGVNVDTTSVTQDYFETMGLAVLEGRPFDVRDLPGAPPVAIVNQALAGQYWPGDTAVGKRLRLGDPAGPVVEIVGVVPDHKVRTLGELPRGFLHFAREQNVPTWGTFVIRTTGDVDALVSATLAELRGFEPNLVAMEAQSYSRLIAVSMLPVRLGATLIGGLSALALLLAGLGIYGVVAFSVSRRTREIGIRMALGLGRRRVLFQVMREGLTLVALGAGAGFVLAALGARTLSAVLHVPPLDPLSYLGAALALAVAAALAAGIPARRAASVDPLVALRQD